MMEEATIDDGWFEMTQFEDQWALTAIILRIDCHFFLHYMQVDDDVDQNHVRFWEDILVWRVACWRELILNFLVAEDLRGGKESGVDLPNGNEPEVRTSVPWVKWTSSAGLCAGWMISLRKRQFRLRWLKDSDNMDDRLARISDHMASSCRK